MRWIRIWTEETFHGTTFQELDCGERGVWFSLLVMAGLGEKKENGIVEMRIGMPYDMPTLAKMINTSEDYLKRCIDKLISVKKIEILEDGRIAICNWKEYQTRYERYEKQYRHIEKNQHSEKNPPVLKTEGEGEGEEEEEKKKKKKEEEIPESLKSLTGFIAAWEKWKKHRKEIGHALKPTTMQAQLNKLQKMSNPVAIINQSIENGWQGLFELKTEYKNKNKNQYGVMSEEEAKQYDKFNRRDI